jgi:1,2-phenylacetyl-CoA epoxidase PaaB subunit
MTMTPHQSRTPAWALNSRDLCRLMRRHQVTIRALAQRMDIPMTRVRYRRQHGIAEWHILRDWLEAITGVDPGAVPHSVRHDAATGPPAP